MEKEVYRAIVLSAQKYTYFLLTAAGAGIALAANQTQGEVLGWAQTPLAIAVICWCLSFFFGCRNVECDQSVLDVNSELLKAQSGKHPVSGI